MSTFTTDELAALLSPFLGAMPAPGDLYPRLSAYLDLLLRWNARTNLTAIRDPREIVLRHFGESVFAGVQLAPRLAAEATLLDFGSGAGFPGLPIQLLLPGLRVTLAESQNKKSSFLREAVRTLGLATEVVPARVETMPADRCFDCVTMRAVDRMESAIAAARTRVAPGGWLAILASEPSADRISVPLPTHGHLLLERAPG